MITSLFLAACAGPMSPSDTHTAPSGDTAFADTGAPEDTGADTDTAPPEEDDTAPPVDTDTGAPEDDPGCDPAEVHATWTDPDGVAYDLSTELSAGVEGKPVALALDASGSLTLCGVWYALVDVTAPDVTIAGAVGAGAAGAGAATLSGGGVGATITVREGAGLAASDLTITGGDASLGGGLHHEGGTLALERVIFEGNTATEGGGLYLGAAEAAALSEVSFIANSASRGGGLYALLDEETSWSGLTFEGNSANDGGGLYLGNKNRYAPLSLSGADFSDNVASSEGGGAWLFWGTAVQITDSHFTRNVASEGGGIYTDVSASLTLEGVEVTENTTVTGAAGVHMKSADDVSFTDVTFERNEGPGAYTSDENGEVTLVLSDVSFTDNQGDGLQLEDARIYADGVTASGNAGAGLRLEGLDCSDSDRDWCTCSGSITDLNAHHNMNSGLIIEHCELEISDAVFDSNSSADSGGGAAILGYSKVELEDVAFSGNTAAGLGGGLFVYLDQHSYPDYDVSVQGTRCDFGWNTPSDLDSPYSELTLGKGADFLCGESHCAAL